MMRTIEVDRGLVMEIYRHRLNLLLNDGCRKTYHIVLVGHVRRQRVEVKGTSINRLNSEKTVGSIV